MYVYVFVNQDERICVALPKECMKQTRLTGLVFFLKQATLERIKA